MEHHKISELLKNSTVSKFAARKWIEVNNLSGSQYSVNKNIRFKTPMLRSNLFDYSDAYIVVKERITIEGDNPINRRNKKLSFQNIAPFRPCISEINRQMQTNAEDLDIVMRMYNLLEYSEIYSMTPGSLWNYYRDKVNDSANEIVANLRVNNNNKTTTNELFEYNT